MSVRGFVKRLYGVYDQRGKLRYIGASTLEDLDSLAGFLRLQQRQAETKIAAGKTPSRAEELFGELIAKDALRLAWLTPPREDWVQVKRRVIAHARSCGIDLVNEADGGPGSEGVRIKAESVRRRAQTLATINDAKAYQMHTMYRLKGYTQRQIAEAFNLTEKGVQKILSGYRRPQVWTAWMNKNRAPIPA